MAFVILFVAAIWAGLQNALAGGGSFVTLPALMLTGMTAQAANITSTVALFPAQIATGLTGRSDVAGASGIPFIGLAAISLVGGAVGAVLLLITPPRFFASLVPWLVLFATLVFAYGSFAPRHENAHKVGRVGMILQQFLISIYGGYFGGGIGFLILAVLSFAGLSIRSAAATKNILAGVMNASAVAIFAFSTQVHWLQALISSVGAIAGGVAGGYAVRAVDEKRLRILVLMIGAALTTGLFFRS